MDDTANQAEEIEALSSIYGEDWKTELGSDRSYSLQITEGVYNVTVYITLAPDYPSQSPPNVQLLAPDLNRMHKQRIALDLDDLYLDYIGQPVVYQLIEKVREYLQSIQKTAELNVQEMEKKSNKTKNKKSSKENSVEAPTKRDIQHGPIIQDRKSTFQGHAAEVHSAKDVKEVTECLLENKKIAEATHNISAYRIQMEKGNILQDYDDDGENQAGRRLSHLLQILDVTNVLVVVSRWYGGIQLGPDRFRHINNAGRQVLEQAGYIEGKK